MRRLLLIFVAVVMAATATAQSPWLEYDKRQQQQILASKGVSPIVRESYASLSSLDDTTRSDLWHRVTQPVRDKRIASLYLYVYESLRPVENSSSQEDIVMIRSYPDYMLSRWDSDACYYDVYDYAYSLGVYGDDADALSVLRKIGSRRYRKRYGNVVETLQRGYALVKESELLRSWVDMDLTRSEVDNECAMREMDVEEYHNVRSSVESIAVNCDDVDIVEHNIAALMSASGVGYYHTVDHKLGKGVTIVRVMLDRLSELFVLTDANGESYTLPSPLYILSDGTFYSLGESNIVIMGRVVDGCVTMYRSANVNVDCERVKCNEQGVYIYGNPCIHLSIE